MSKKIKYYIKIHVLSGMANPSPPIGPILGQRGLNIMNFCKSFNEKTSNVEKGIPLPVIITVYSDRTFDFVIKSPTVTYLLKKISSLKKGSSNPGSNILLEINKKLIFDIAKIKLIDTNTNKIDSVVKSIIGSARSMGISINDK